MENLSGPHMDELGQVLARCVGSEFLGQVSEKWIGFMHHFSSQKNFKIEYNED